VSYVDCRKFYESSIYRAGKQGKMGSDLYHPFFKGFPATCAQGI